MPDRRRIFEILELAQPGDQASRACDVALITLISLNVLAVLLESIPAVGLAFQEFFHTFDRLSVAIFSVEYGLRLWTAVESPDSRFRKAWSGRLRYALTPTALIDLLAILPFFLAALGSFDLRFLRVLRLLRILKLSHYFSALDVLLEVVRAERYAFGASFFLLMLGILVASSGIYLFEHQAQPVSFGSIPASMWWAVATLTTVGYGDVTPVTVGGKIFGASITIMGIGMVALPTGILASGFASELRRRRRIYASELGRALEDGVIDEREQQQLEDLRQYLGLSETDVTDLDAAGSEPAGPRRLAAAALASVERCPHCGKPLGAR